MYHNHVKINQLQSSTKYYYICGDGVAGWSDEFSFTVSKYRFLFINNYINILNALSINLLC